MGRVFAAQLSHLRGTERETIIRGWVFGFRGTTKRKARRRFDSS